MLRIILGLISFHCLLFLFSGLLACCVVVFSYPVRWPSICLTHEFGITLVMVFTLSHNCQYVTTYLVSLYDRESGWTLGVLIKLGREDDSMGRQQQPVPKPQPYCL